MAQVTLVSNISKLNKFGILGTAYGAKPDEFLGKFQTPFDPPPSFWKIMLQFLIMDIIEYNVEYMQGGTRAR